MTTADERRNPHVRRVELTTLVDICLQDGSQTPFQAESANVSGRGMHVRTSHLPDLGEGLICRFEHEEHEILVEGSVAWRSESEEAGEFGIKFTALDADSADILTELSRRHVTSPPPPTVFDDEDDDELGGLEFAAGKRVRLNIDGLGAPMKASVHEATERRLRVGSNLEFLKVGRSLEIEDIDGEDHRGATIDSVNVVLNPATCVPELVVQLRYEGISPTPAPVSVGAGEEDVFASADIGGPDFDNEAFGEDEDEHEAPGGWQPTADVLQQRLGTVLDGAGSAASKAGGLLKSALGKAKETAAEKGMTTFPKMPLSMMSRASGDESEASPTSSSRETSRRRTQTTRRRSRAPAHLRSGIHDMGMISERPRRTASAAVARGAATKGKGWGRYALLGALLVGVVGSAYAMRSSGAETDGATAEASSPSESASETDNASSGAAPAAVAAKPEPTGASHPDGISAEVPLFGPRSMATAEPVVQGESVDDATAEKLAAAAAVGDETWEEAAKPQEVDASKPWGRGRLHLPTIHRIRLDSAGKEIAGVVEPSGFTVVIPGRKAMESGRAIQKRDKRIVGVKASNTAQGARIGFSFRGSVPPYRVKLRKDFVEFWISAPQDGVAQL